MEWRTVSPQYLLMLLRETSDPVTVGVIRREVEYRMIQNSREADDLRELAGKVADKANTLGMEVK